VKAHKSHEPFIAVASFEADASSLKFNLSCIPGAVLLQTIRRKFSLQSRHVKGGEEKLFPLLPFHQLCKLEVSCLEAPLFWGHERQNHSSSTLENWHRARDTESFKSFNQLQLKDDCSALDVDAFSKNCSLMSRES
jgi:hypothetical protein